MDLSEFEQTLTLLGHRKYTVECHLRRIRQVLVACQPLTKETFEKFLVAKRQAGGKASSLNRLIITLRHYARCYDIEWGKNVQLIPDRDEPDKEIFSDHEIELIIGLPCPIRFRKNVWDRWTMWLMVIAFSGMRASEVSTLTVDQIDLGSNNFVLPKTKTKPRTVPIASILREPLERYLADKTHYLFPTPSKRGHVWRQGWQKHVALRIKLVGIKRKGLSAHCFRHSFASTLWEEGVPLPDLMNICGWRSVKTAMRYSHLGNRSAQKSINRHSLIQKHSKPDEMLISFIEEAKKRGLFNSEKFSWQITDDSLHIEIVSKRATTKV